MVKMHCDSGHSLAQPGLDIVINKYLIHQLSCSSVWFHFSVEADLQWTVEVDLVTYSLSYEC